MWILFVYYISCIYCDTGYYYYISLVICNIIIKRLNMKKSSKANNKRSISLSDGSSLSHNDLETMLIAVNGTIHGKTGLTA